ncbi:MAG: hypothetical protein KDA60_17250, partial [Planctomycetales bacterium]|nr:hypothetical protein [Planctomycetales bacterium]
IWILLATCGFSHAAEDVVTNVDNDLTLPLFVDAAVEMLIVPPYNYPPIGATSVTAPLGDYLVSSASMTTLGESRADTDRLTTLGDLTGFSTLPFVEAAVETTSPLRVTAPPDLRVPPPASDPVTEFAAQVPHSNGVPFFAAPSRSNHWMIEQVDFVVLDPAVVRVAAQDELGQLGSGTLLADPLTFAPEAEGDMAIAPRTLAPQGPFLVPAPVEIVDVPGHVPTASSNVPLPMYSIFAARTGAWIANGTGSPTQVGEFQSLQSSWFANADGLLSDGLRTWDFQASILDRDASSFRSRIYGPTFSGRFEHERYLRRLDSDPLDAFVDFDQQPPGALPPGSQAFRDMKEDLNVGEDFAIRVEELNSSMRGKLTSHVDWRLNVWSMRKHGERQSIAMAHCFTATNATDINGNPVGGVSCHMLSQRQRIDWRTTEIEPVFTTKLGPVTAEYAHTVRTLNTDDQLVTRPYDGLGITGDQPYAIVPENITNIDRLKVTAALANRRDIYAKLYSGNTENYFRDTNRRFRGLDLRLTDRSLDNVNFSAYGKKYVQSGQFPLFLVPFEDVAQIRLPINYDRSSAGFDTTWRPLADDWSWGSNFRLTSGYEYRELQRENATYTEAGVTVDQAGTNTHEWYARAAMGWTPTLDSSIQYRVSFMNDPLFAISTNATTNTSLPEQVHRIELQNTWAPSPVFAFSSQVGLVSGWNYSDVAAFDENDYEWLVTAWYAPTPRWSVFGGLAFYSKWIDQTVTLGTRSVPLASQWEYGGESDFVNLGTSFAWTPRTRLTASVYFIDAVNAFDPLTPWPDLAGYSDVRAQTTRFNAGVDYDLSEFASCYLRYQMFDYEDEGTGLVSGRAEMLLLGGTSVF